MQDIPIGEVSFHGLKQDKMTAEQNIKIQAKHRKKGYAKDALITFLDFCFNKIGLNKMMDEIAIKNTVAQEFFTKSGFKHFQKKSKDYWVELTRDEFNLKYQGFKKQTRKLPDKNT